MVEKACVGSKLDVVEFLHVEHGVPLDEPDQVNNHTRASTSTRSIFSSY